MIILVFLLACASAGAGTTPVNVRDLARIVRLADPRFSPDGKTIALVETRADLDADEFQSEIVLVDVTGHQVRPLTRARHHAASPRWSPTGEAIAFLGPDADKIVQVYVMPMAGGDALQITHGKDGVEQFAWSPDGSTIAFAMADPKPELKGEDKFRTAFKVGNDDMTISEAVRSVHLWLVSAHGGEPKRLTSGTWSLPSSLPPGPPSSPISWSKDGNSIIIVRQASPSTGDQFLSRIQVVDLDSGAIRSLTGDTMLEGYPVLSPDGTTVAYWRNRGAQPWNFQDVWLAPFTGGAGRDISVALDKNVYTTRWSPQSDWLLVGGNVATTVGLWRVTPRGAVSQLNLGAVMPTDGYWIDVDIARDGRIAFIGQTKTDPYELYLLPAAERPSGGAGDGQPEALTQANSGLADLGLARSETLTWTGPGGRALDGVITYPLNYQEGRSYPLVLYIHGGPNSSSRERFNLMPQLLATHDWIVFEPNYRGSDNHDNAFFAAIYKDAGQGPGEDVMSGIAYLKKRGLVDSARMAVTGWSYGGFMTTWLAGHYPVWKAAVAGAPVTDWVEMYDLSDGNVTQVAATGASPYVGEGMSLNRRQSPANSVTKITAPTLIMCDTGDFRVPIPQSFGLYRALKDNHVITEFYAIPTGGHFPNDPIKQMDVFRRWNEWLVTYLK
ncbi:MAG: S9 family peptidase [Pseudomonadota bacterium]|nr:S9 family peptidase [Pseudomonadota bacterium]